MLDLERLNRIRLSGHPIGQRLFSNLMLRTNYAFPLTRTELEIHGWDRLPQNGGSFLIMNHTDRYNCWPFQTEMHKRGVGYTATWIKGKYYENSLMAWFLDAMNNIPIPSKGYLLTKDFQDALKRGPSSEEYSALKDFSDGRIDEDQCKHRGGAGVTEFLARTPDRPYPASLKRRFEAQMGRVVEIHREALASGLNLMVFPQGTRSRRLTRGHTGVAQMALHLRTPILPIGCSGSDRCYLKNLPFSRGGKITYRVGTPLRPEHELQPFFPVSEYLPFTSEAERHEEKFRALTALMMERLNDLVDPDYQFESAEARTQAAERRADRFV